MTSFINKHEFDQNVNEFSQKQLYTVLEGKYNFIAIIKIIKRCEFSQKFEKKKFNDNIYVWLTNDLLEKFRRPSGRLDGKKRTNTYTRHIISSLIESGYLDCVYVGNKRYLRVNGSKIKEVYENIKNNFKENLKKVREKTQEFYLGLYNKFKNTNIIGRRFHSMDYYTRENCAKEFVEKTKSFEEKMNNPKYKLKVDITKSNKSDFEKRMLKDLADACFPLIRDNWEHMSLTKYDLNGLEFLERDFDKKAPQEGLTLKFESDEHQKAFLSYENLLKTFNIWLNHPPKCPERAKDRERIKHEYERVKQRYSSLKYDEPKRPDSILRPWKEIYDDEKIVQICEGIEKEDKLSASLLKVIKVIKPTESHILYGKLSEDQFTLDLQNSLDRRIIDRHINIYRKYNIYV